MTQFQVVGQPVPRVEGFQKVTGQARYAADFNPPGTIWGKCLHAPYSHARIVSIDTRKAQSMPGVHAVITGADTREGALWGRAVKDAPPLAFERVRYYGERVAAVAADDEDLAQAALEQIEVAYEEWPAVFDPFDALRDDAPVLHPNFNNYFGFKYKQTSPSNIHHQTRLERGDVEQGFFDADFVVENTYVTQRQSQGMLEPQAIVVWIDPADERVHLWHCNKVPYFIRGALAACAGIPPERIVIHPTFIGGDFGNKGNSRLTPICYYLARASGRPVRMISDYKEEFLAGNPRHHVVIQLKTGVKRDGTLTAHTVNHVVNSGAYAAFKSYGTIAGANESAGPYRVANSRIDSTFVYTNTVPGGFMRAPGEPEGVFAIESHMDEVARRIGMDPVAFRLKNLIVEGDETAFGEVLHDVRARETLSAAVNAAGYNSPKPAYVGRGVAVGERGTGAGEGTVEVRLQPDGRAILGTPMFDQGTGTYTTITQVASEELGIPAERFEIEVWDTDELESDSGLTGSRGTHVNTLAAHTAAVSARDDLVGLATEYLGWPEGEVSFSGGRARRANTGEAVGWEELLARCGQTVRARAHTTASRSHRTSFVAQVAEVAVDPETGSVQILRFTTAHDSGVVVNPLGYQGQVNGGFQHGLGYALMEELVVEDGRVTTLSFGDYKMPTVRDMPPLSTVVLESVQGEGPYNIRAIGEAPCIPVAPAIANAVADAVGVRIRELPVTAQKVYDALTRAKEVSESARA